MIGEIMGARVPEEAVKKFCEEVGRLGLVIEDQSVDKAVILRIAPITSHNREQIRALFRTLHQACHPGSYVNWMEVSEEPIRPEPIIDT